MSHPTLTNLIVFKESLLACINLTPILVFVMTVTTPQTYYTIHLFLWPKRFLVEVPTLPITL